MLWHYVETPDFHGYAPKDDPSPKPCPSCERHPLQCTCQAASETRPEEGRMNNLEQAIHHANMAVVDEVFRTDAMDEAEVLEQAGVSSPVEWIAKQVKERNSK